MPSYADGLLDFLRGEGYVGSIADMMKEWADDGFSGGGGGFSGYSFDSVPTWRPPRPLENSTIGSYVNQEMYLYPIIVPEDLTLTGLGFEVTTLQAGSSVFACVYADNGNFFPGALVKATAAISTATTGIKSESFAGVALPAGGYWVGVLTLSPGVLAMRMAYRGDDHWHTMPQGTGATPTWSAGNEALVVRQQGIATPPSVAGGVSMTDSNDPKKMTFISMKLAGAA